MRILANSQDATDVILVHGAYVKYRPELLRAGVEPYELKPGFAPDPEEEESAGVGGSSRASLHSKTMATDGRDVFIGSFNFDPRSFALNTEMGVLIESPRLADGLAGAFATSFRDASYRVMQGEDGRLAWEETVAGDIVRHKEEPGATAFSRLFLPLLALLPIEWQSLGLPVAVGQEKAKQLRDHFQASRRPTSAWEPPRTFTVEFQSHGT